MPNGPQRGDLDASPVWATWQVPDGLGGIPVRWLGRSENGSLLPVMSGDGPGKDALEGLPAFFFFAGGGNLSFRGRKGFVGPLLCCLASCGGAGWLLGLLSTRNARSHCLCMVT